ncbi:MAG: DUF4012 domain-containing protein [bacterium]|nr:DUF4012 domain-containing protein [bacterium]
MKNYIETIEEKEKVIIISKLTHPFLLKIKQQLKNSGCDVFFSSRIPKNLSTFQYCFFINENIQPEILLKNQINILIFLNKTTLANSYVKKHIKHTKIINIMGDDVRDEHVDRILWFSFSKSHEHILNFSVGKLNKPHIQIHFNKLNIFSLITPKRIILSIFGILFIIHILYIPPLIFSSFYTYKAYQSLKSENIQSAKDLSQKSKKIFNISQTLFNLVRPTYLLFSIAMVPDNLIILNDKSINTFIETSAAIENSQEILKSIMKKDKTQEEKAYLILRIDSLKKELAIIEDNISIISTKIPIQFKRFSNLKLKMNEGLDGIAKIRKLIQFSDSLLAKDTEKKYLLLFANNMELRPGGGFLGSFGVVKMKDMTFNEIQVYDVYDADGQLKAHIEPPLPIKKYLNMPHLFLRDSNYSPDFYDENTQARFFLEKEMNMTDFSGVVLLTTTGIQNILSAFGNVYLPDFNDNINQENFYLKTQIHVETNFFPGSTQKKTFLSSLTRQLLLNLDTVSPKKLALFLKKSLDEKQLTIYLDDPIAQETIDSFYWSGRTIEPRCTSTNTNCIVDYLLPYDMNVGANKVNYFIKRFMSLKSDLQSDGHIKNIFSIQFKNESTSDVFPGGIYKNYFQLLLPTNADIKQITKDGTLVDEYEINNDRFKKIGFYLEVPPQKTINIQIQYSLSTKLLNGKGIYQLIVQKQIGSSNNDFTFELHIPKNISLVNQNFSPLVNDSNIVYNTVLSADKIFFIELMKR